MTAQQLQRIEAAVAAHDEWLARLRDAIRHGDSEYQPAAVRRHDQCALGAWLDRDFPPTLRESPVYDDLRRTHAQFHVQAASIMTLALAGRRAEAERMMAPRSEFLALSGWLIVKLRGLRDCC